MITNKVIPTIALKLSAPARRGLQAVGILTVGQLVQESPTSLMEIKGFGKSAMLRVLVGLNRLGIDWQPDAQQIIREQEERAPLFGGPFRGYFTASVEDALNLCGYYQARAAAYAGRHFENYLNKQTGRQASS